MRATRGGLPVMFALLPLALIIANAVLMPYESSAQRGYLQKRSSDRSALRRSWWASRAAARAARRQCSRTCCSSTHQPSPQPAASRSWGVTRHLREDPHARHRFLVVEMGAYAVGSIARLCAHAARGGLITAVGDMHLERLDRPT